MYNCKIICDSMSNMGVRLTTMEVTFPRIVLAEFNTHRMFSRNSASSRAIPVEKQIGKLKDDPFTPIMRYKSDSGGMQPGSLMEDVYKNHSETNWSNARLHAINHAVYCDQLNTAKEITNRLLEPFMWHTVIVTATDWDNFFNLRTDKNAQLEIRTVAEMMQEEYNKEIPIVKSDTHYHIPFIKQQDIDEVQVITKNDTPLTYELLMKISSAKCARVSYLTHDGERSIGKDIEMADRLIACEHMSPFEHAAIEYDRENDEHIEMGMWKLNQLTVDDSENIISDIDQVPYFGNFKGWVQYRKMLPNEAIFNKKGV